MSRGTLLIIGIFALGTILFSWAYFNIGAITKKTGQQATNKSAGPQPSGGATGSNSAGSVNLPVDINSSDVLAAGVIYTFNATITKIDTVAQGILVTTNISDKPGIPKFIVGSNTIVRILGITGKQITSSKDDLKPGQNVRITARYGIKRDNWATNRVTILAAISPAPSAAPSAAPTK